MTENYERIRVLLVKYSSKESSTTEERELFALLNNTKEEEVEPLLNNILENTEPSYDNARRDRILASVLQHNGIDEKEVGGTEEDNKVVPMRYKWKRIAVAASIIGLLFVAGYWMMNREWSSVSGPETVTITNDVKAPDKNRAMIILTDGTTVYLDSAMNGELAMQNGVKVVKTVDGRIEYSHEPSAVSGELKYNTLSNPRGSIVINMTLVDGSRVWLNAGSSITYPVAFTGNERKVAITGEAYFEVAHNASKPFKVSKDEMEVTVLGTHFNVNAYDDENEIKVTLLEGSVRVQSSVVSRESAVIKPGEQAQITSRINILKSVDLDAVMAWKNGYFDFKKADIKTVMRELARWYDVDVVYEGAINETFYLKARRGASVSDLFKILETGGAVRLKVEGRKIIVTP